MVRPSISLRGLSLSIGLDHSAIEVTSDGSEDLRILGSREDGFCLRAHHRQKIGPRVRKIHFPICC